MDSRSFVVSQLALFSWREGNRLAEGAPGVKVAIAAIISNRVKAGWQNGDWLRVLEAVPVHAAEEEADLHSFLMPDLWDPGWRRLVKTCEDIYDGTFKDDVTMTPSAAAIAEALPGADTNPMNGPRPSFFYANLSLPIREWFLTKIIRSVDHPRTVEIYPVVLFG